MSFMSLLETSSDSVGHIVTINDELLLSISFIYLYNIYRGI